eukprot:m.289784 g.289784  ORF g.289784 m.289784 type:complete len:129 (+) comp15810_c0_seq16:294-680(+)
MESNSEKNRIHLSDTAAKLVSKQDASIDLLPREKMTIKGKGVMQTYFLKQEEQAIMVTLDTKQLEQRLEQRRSSRLSRNPSSGSIVSHTPAARPSLPSIKSPLASRLNPAAHVTIATPTTVVDLKDTV